MQNRYVMITLAQSITSATTPSWDLPVIILRRHQSIRRPLSSNFPQKANTKIRPCWIYQKLTEDSGTRPRRLGDQTKLPHILRKQKIYWANRAKTKGSNPKVWNQKTQKQKIITTLGSGDKKSEERNGNKTKQSLKPALENSSLSSNNQYQLQMDKLKSCLEIINTATG
jgi:hypothetical protein